MKLSGLNFGAINKKQAVSLNKNQYKTQPNFCSKCDIVDFSSKSSDRLNILRELIDLGYNSQEAQRMLGDHFGSDTYKELTEGFLDEDEEEMMEEPIKMHWIEIDRHLTPTEAILYIENGMDDYYLQHTDSGSLPLDFKYSTQGASFYEIGKANFLPCDLAKYMLKGYDIAMSGMILKGKIDEETAQNVQEYYNLSKSSTYKDTKNVQQAEYTISLIAENMGKINMFTSSETDENGELLTGFTRPLTSEEAVILITDDYMPQDAESINKYIKLNDYFGCSLYDMSIKDLWDKDADELIEKSEAKKAQEMSNISKMPQARRKFKTLQEALQYFDDKTSGMYSEFFEDMAQLDDKKFRRLISLKHLKTEAMLASVGSRELRQKNIQILNSMSDELIERMITDESGKKHKLDCIVELLQSEKLEERVAYLEEALKNNTWTLLPVPREAVIDYLINSSVYLDSKRSLEEFRAILQGKNIDEHKSEGKILTFPKKIN